MKKTKIKTKPRTTTTTKPEQNQMTKECNPRSISTELHSLMRKINSWPPVRPKALSGKSTPNKAVLENEVLENEVFPAPDRSSHLT